MTENQTKARGVASIGAERLAQLNAGAEAATLTECLAVDFAALMASILPGIGDDALAEMRAAASTGISRRMPLAAKLIAESLGPSALQELAHHSSDTARGWACFMVAAVDDMSLAERLTAIRPLADDSHFGVREWAWIAVRPHLAANLDQAIALLAAGWTSDPSERIRRFASESIRPRGVWCAHIAALRKEPERAFCVLEPLRADLSPYVQDSVGNWLNDAAKDRPEWVQALCARWSAESSGPATTRICRRALRSIATKSSSGNA
ncbi:HEAT repeat domain-containing protein [Ensifer sp. 2YAB10]|uniref:HEAT repeat domain-containing protein n=1 Tax=unclassified Ensifer TaxID=2633371 RepID=UPI001A60D668|nr:HEAT repeat domain-containing protein [Ensifer sp. SSB1]MBK5565842.1 DNA alkylation repair protein [Ensifer sp. SSB1]